MTRVFLAAGVAALAIAAPAASKPGGGHGGGGDGGGQSAQVQRGGGGQSFQQRGGGGGQRIERQAAPRMEQRSFQRAERPQRSFERVERQQQRFANVERQQRMERVSRQQERFAQRAERQQRIERVSRQERFAQRAERQQRIERVSRQQERFAQRAERQQRIHGGELQQMRIAERQLRQNDRAQRVAELHNGRDDRIARIDNRFAQREALGRLNGDTRFANDDARFSNNAVGFGIGGCPPGLADKGCMPPGQAMKANRALNADAFRYSRLATLAADPRTRILAPTQVAGFVGSPLSTLSNVVALSALPSGVSYLYPDTDDYYYRYGNGYIYRVDRGNDLVNWILPALAGGFMPGQYLPSSYMNSYVPDVYGLNSFYPSSYGYNSPYAYNAGYGYNSGYGYDLCNRYYGGVVYQVDCASGLIEDVVPVYAGGYGVGQMLPASYGYYNVPSQYRDLYYNTSDANYWYAPGAIYQYDPQSSLITSVAALLAPGFTVGQALPAGYGMYNVPLAYRDTYYDTPNAWYRYNNGYIYQVDPTTQLVTAIVASLLT